MMTVVSLGVFSCDLALYTGVRYGTDTEEFGVVVSFPFTGPDSFTIATKEQSITISWPAYWAVISWLFLLFSVADALVFGIHHLKFKNLLLASILLTSSVVLWIVNISYRAIMYAALSSLFSDVYCEECTSGRNTNVKI